MNVKTGELKARLSHYLRRVREGSETIVVYDRNTPIALLTPLEQDAAVAERRRAVAAAGAALAARGFVLEPPASWSWPPPATPETAPDERTDISTIDSTRGGRDY